MVSSVSGNAEQAIRRLREKLLSREGKNGLRGLAKHLALDRGATNSQTTPQALRAALRSFGLVLSDEDFELVSKRFDPEHSGQLSSYEFFLALRGAVSPRRLTVIQAAFRRLAGNANANAIELGTFRDYYQTTRHPAVVTRHTTQVDAAHKFLSAWTPETNGDGLVTLEEFINYYTGVNYFVQEDKDFELLLTRSWNLDRPDKLTREQELERQNTTVVSKFGTDHPLYYTSSTNYGRELEQAFKPETRFNKAGAFTKREPPPSPSCGLNTSTTRNRFY